MRTVNMHDAKSQLPKLVESAKSGETDPVSLTRIGVAKDRFVAPSDPSAQDAEVAALFLKPRD